MYSSFSKIWQTLCVELRMRLSSFSFVRSRTLFLIALYFTSSFPTSLLDDFYYSGCSMMCTISSTGRLDILFQPKGSYKNRLLPWHSAKCMHDHHDVRAMARWTLNGNIMPFFLHSSSLYHLYSSVCLLYSVFHPVSRKVSLIEFWEFPPSGWLIL